MKIKTQIRLCRVSAAVLQVCAFCCFAALVWLSYLFLAEGFFCLSVELPRILLTAAVLAGLLGSIAARNRLAKTEFDLLTQQAEINDFYKKLYRGRCLR